MTISRIDERSDLTRKERRIKSDSSMGHCKQHSTDEGDVDSCVKRLRGDGLVVRMHSNHRVLEITGDGCWIVLSKNSGSVHVVGDGCKLHVYHNVGDIKYTGDGGQVLLGPDSSREKVKFVGDGGRVILDSCPETDPKKSTKERRNKTAGTYARSFTCPCKEIINDVPEREDDHEISNLDNVLNDMKERSLQGKYGKRNEETRKSLRHPTVTTIITKIRSDGQCVTKRFGDSSLIVNSRGRPVTKSRVPRTSATNVGLK